MNKIIYWLKEFWYWIRGYDPLDEIIVEEHLQKHAPSPNTNLKFFMRNTPYGKRKCYQLRCHFCNKRSNTTSRKTALMRRYMCQECRRKHEKQRRK